jgi:hypothetical protein
MGDYESSTQVIAGEQVLFEYLSNVSNLPKYFTQMTRAEQTGPQEVETEAEVDGVTRAGRAWLQVDHARQHLEWGSEGDSSYSGQLDVTGDTRQSTVTVRLHTERVGDEDPRVLQGLQDSLAAIKRLVEVGPA